MNELTITALATPDERLRALTYPRYAALVTGADSAVHKLVAWQDGAPVGLALLEPRESRLLSVAVSPGRRRQGVGLALMRAAEDRAREQGLAALVAHHNDRMAGLEAWLGLLRRAEWPAPTWTFMRLFGTANWAQEAAVEWESLLRRLAATGFTATAWEERSGADQVVIDTLLADALPGFNPRWAEPILAGPSIVIREHGQVVGWILATELAEPGTTYYPIGYVVPRLQRRGWLIGGLVAACLRQGPDGISCFQTAADNDAMQSLMQRRLDKWTLRRDCQFETRKSLIA